MKRKEKAGMKSSTASPQPLSPWTYGPTHLLPPYKEDFSFFLFFFFMKVILNADREDVMEWERLRAYH